MTLKIAVDGDTEIWNDCPDPHYGGGTYPVTPITDQDLVFIGGKRVVPKGQYYPGHCGATAGDASACSTLVFINGTPVCREGDIGLDGCHTLYGIVVAQQDFVFDGG